MLANLASPLASHLEQRAATRHPCAVPTTCQPPSAWCKDPWQATIRDISTGGISLSLKRRFERNTGLAIELPTADGDTTTVLVKIVHIEPHPTDGWLLGCTFISELSEEEVEQVLKLDPVSHATLSLEEEAKKSGVTPRIRGVLFQARVRRGELLRWYVKKLDLAGDWPLPRGNVLTFRVGGAGEALGGIDLQIRECKLFGSYWVVEGDLVGQPSRALLRRLMQADGM